MTFDLPDVSITDRAENESALAWVGMQGIDLPVLLPEAKRPRELHARVDAQVDLPSPDVKGIHMSRLYRLLGALTEEEALSPTGLGALLDRMLESHADCGSRNARLRLAFDLLVRRPALLTEGISGWNAYPVRIDASSIGGTYALEAEVVVRYSSTCPCSAALTRQVIEQTFRSAFEGRDGVASDEVANWLRQNATAATPHSQRSEAVVKVALDGESDAFGLHTLIDTIEAALGTPVQTAVKRADEQAFAKLNGQNLMFVEDAARRLEAALGDYRQPRIHVRHLESLHPHDAVAWAMPTGRG